MSAITGPVERSQGRSKGLLKEKLELEKIKTKDGKTRVTLKPIDDELTFDKGFYVFIRALQLLRAHNDGTVLVGLGGASGSGKTAFCEKVKDFMPGITLISMDNYNDASKLVDGNFDDPRLTDYDTLMKNLTDLKAGKPADVPIYDFKLSKRVGYVTMPVPGSRVVIIEGIYALSERLKPLLDLRVSIAGGVHFDLIKRVLRDINRSGQGPEEIIQQITDTVFPMYKAFIEPDLNAAQLKIHNSFNPFTGFMNATYILKSPRADSLTQQAVVQVLGEGAVVKTEAEMYDIHLLPPNEDPETCASWLRMRNRDGRYTLMFEEWVTEGNFIISPRIQFEVSVRVLGGLMSLGYQVGTILRRTSTLMQSVAADITVKFDDVQNLGNYVQVQGKDRDKVAAIAESLNLAEFVPRSYIEQVQLAKLTQDFQAFTDDVKKRFSVNGNSVLEDAMYGSSPPYSNTFAGRDSVLGFGGGINNRHMGGRYGAIRSSNGGGHGPVDDDALLSCSAPVRGSMPIAIQPPIARKHTAANAGSLSAVSAGASVASPSSSAVAAVGSTVGSSSSSEAGSLPGSLGDNGASSVGAGPGSAVVGSAGSGGAAGLVSRATGIPPAGATAAAAGSRGSSLLGQQLRRGSQQGSSQHGSNSSLQGMEGPGIAAGASGSSTASTGAPPEQQQRSHRVPSVPGDYPGSNSVNTSAIGADAGMQLLRRLQEQMEVVSEGFKRHSGMQLHLDALTHQYKHLNESMAALTAATQTLRECVQQLQQQQPPAAALAAQQPAQQVVPSHNSRSSFFASSLHNSSNLASLGAGLAVGTLVSALLLRNTGLG